MTTSKNSGESLIDSNDGLDCPLCDNCGWWLDQNPHTVEPIQVQCEFCYTEPRSKFNGQSNKVISGTSN